MSFWTTSTGEVVAQEKEFDMGGGKSQPIPEGTRAVSFVEEAKETEYNGERYYNLKWKVATGDYKNRVTFQKVRAFDSNPAKRDKALKMLMAINMNCGGKLHQLETAPTDMDLMTNICNKPMMVEYAVWEMEGRDPGNWIKAVSSAKGAASKPAAQKPAVAAPTEPPMDFDDDIPFAPIGLMYPNHAIYVI